MHNPLTIDALVQDLVAHAKTPQTCVVGVEHELFLFDKGTGRRASYDQIAAVMQGLMARDPDWQPVDEQGKIIGLTHPQKCKISIEPGGQFELATCPSQNIHTFATELDSYQTTLQQICIGLGLQIVAQGFDPISRRDDVPWMPKGRYDIMRRYMPTRGGHGLDMMLRTCTVQANLDYMSEVDMVAKMRVSMALQPFVTALFANSHQVEGASVPYRSYRSFIWTDTDPDRCGILPFVFQPDFGFEAYVQWVVDVPMYFIRRDGHYIDKAGASFRDFMASGQATIQDWWDHLTTAFPEARLKHFIEQRGADVGSPAMIKALPALWVGLLYDADNLAQWHDQVMTWPIQQILDLRDQVPALGLDGDFMGRPVRDWAQKIVQSAAQGLQRRAIQNTMGNDESIYLEPLLTTL